jgi:cephalosporin-C deacetylase
MFSHSFPFDPTYGYDLEALLRVAAPPGPADFADFWRQIYAAACSVPPKLASREVTRPTDAQRIFEVEFTGLDDFRVGGWITLPRTEPITRALVVGHGYGGRTAPEPQPLSPHAAAIYPCARGMNRSARPDLPNTAAWHVLHGITARETYLHRFCAADIWAAASALLELVPQAATNLEYCGTSFGGGMGAMALPWDQRFVRACLEVPSFGNHPLRLKLPCVGSGEAVRVYHRHHCVAQPPSAGMIGTTPPCCKVLEVLSYFDAATAARYIRIPMLFANALFDPAVPPPGQFAVHNAVPGTKRLHVRQAGHFTWAGELEDDQRCAAAKAQWLAE